MQAGEPVPSVCGELVACSSNLQPLKHGGHQGFLFCPNLQFLSELKVKCPEETAQSDYNSDILSGRKC